MNGTKLTVHTSQAGALCTVIVYDLPPTPGQPSAAGGLGPQYTDASGNTTWTWTVEPTAPMGLAQVQVTCSYRALLGFAFTTMVIA